jgi:hypothetical protein
LNDSDSLRDDEIDSPDYLLNPNKDFLYNQTYRFAYKNKQFPKLATEYPIYKVT